MEVCMEVKIADKESLVSPSVVNMLAEIERESAKRKFDTKPYLLPLKAMAIYYRICPEYMLTCLKPILEMIQNNIYPGNIFQLHETFMGILKDAEIHAAESRKKRMAQESRIEKMLKKRVIFEKIRQDYKNSSSSRKSVVQLIIKYFPEAKNNSKVRENLRQQYYRAIRGEGGVPKSLISDPEFVHLEFLRHYLFEKYGIAQEIDGQWFFSDGKETLGMPRSRIDAVLNRKKYEQMFNEYWAAQLTNKKKEF